MKQFCLTILFAFTITIGYAQKELQINYKAESGCCFNGLEIESILRANSKYVLYQESAETGISVSPGEEQNRILNLCNIFKDFQSNTLWSNEEKYVVKEKMNLFQWTFMSGADTILGYKCRKAEANFRGRDYTAWFTTEIPFKASPWKICGLPGVVLKLKSSDGFYLLEAKNIAILDVKKELKIPFKVEKSISWESYKIAYKKDIE